MKFLDRIMIKIQPEREFDAGFRFGCAIGFGLGILVYFSIYYLVAEYLVL